jgi:cell division protease FtsH
MSKSLGPRTFGKREEMVFLGRELSEERDYGDHVAEEIDLEVKELINHAYQQAQQILTDGKPKLVQIAEYLIEHEAVTGDELTRLLNLGEFGSEGDPGTPAKPPDTPTPYAPRPAQPPIMPNPAPSLSSQSYRPPGSTPSDASN